LQIKFGSPINEKIERVFEKFISLKGKVKILEVQTEDARILKVATQNPCLQM